MTVKCLNEIEKEKIGKAYLCGIKPKELAEIWCVSTRTVKRVLVELEMLAPETKKIEVSEEDQETLKTLKELNLNHESIVALVESQSFTPSNLIKTLGQMPDKQYDNLMNIVSNVRSTQQTIDSNITVN